MAWILWYPYKCEIIFRKPRHHDKLRKREFLYVRNWNPWQAERRRDPREHRQGHGQRHAECLRHSRTGGAGRKDLLDERRRRFG